MIRASACAIALLAVLAVPAPSTARPLGIELWTDRGQDAVYQPGEGIQIKVRASDDAYLLVYEIDAEGYVHLLFPHRSGSSFIDGRQTFRIPEPGARDQLVVDGPTGEGYIVAIAARDPFESLPWYLRPYDPQAAEIGYIGQEDAEDGITREGQIVGDPFVAMERIRRAVLQDPEDRDEFATAYTEYYVHERVRYPRYMCYDCHRPGYWRWWDGFDPYYTTCSVFDFRVNWGWSWGPTYWFNFTPYYVYVVRNDCPPRYRPNSGFCFSSWDGWHRWNQMWTGRLVRYKSDPPPGYVPPSRYGWETRKPGLGPAPSRRVPPGFLASKVLKGRPVTPLPVQRVNDERPIVPRTDWRPGGELRRPEPGRVPVGRLGRGVPPPGRIERPQPSPRSVGDLRPTRRDPSADPSPRIIQRNPERPTPRAPYGGREVVPGDRRIERMPVERAPVERTPREGRYERPRAERPPAQTPRVERPRPGGSERPAPRIERTTPRPAPPRPEPARDKGGNDERGKGRG